MLFIHPDIHPQTHVYGPVHIYGLLSEQSSFMKAVDVGIDEERERRMEASLLLTHCTVGFGLLISPYYSYIHAQCKLNVFVASILPDCI